MNKRDVKRYEALRNPIPYSHFTSFSLEFTPQTLINAQNHP
jgi:hypothetical protein